jgi:hypothetical protein
MKLGDAVAVPAQFVARRIDNVLGTDIEHCSGCTGPGGRKERLNNFGDRVQGYTSATYDRFFGRNKQRKNSACSEQEPQVNQNPYEAATYDRFFKPAKKHG